MTFTPANTMTMKDEKRRVRFASDDAAADQQQRLEQIESPRQPLVLTDQTCGELWYQPDEIAALKHDTRNLVLYGRNSFGETEMSGLERYSAPRTRHKKECTRYILAIFHLPCGKDVECLGDAARNSTYWACNVASQQGYYDYCAVYDPLANILKDDVDFKDFVENGDKRKAEPLSAVFCGRKVRQRTITSVTMPQAA
jgi:hypothetical protein